MSSDTDTVFVVMYHPALGNAQVQAPLLAVPTYQSHGWLLLDPNATPPPVATPFLTQGAADSRYVRDWAGAEAVTAGAVRMAPDGHVIVRTANGTTRSSYDSTEQGAWTAVGGGSGTSLPTQAGNSGKFLTTDGTVISWGTVAGGGTTSVTDNGDGTASTTSSSVADNGDGTATAA